MGVIGGCLVLLGWMGVYFVKLGLGVVLMVGRWGDCFNGWEIGDHFDGWLMGRLF